MADRRIETEILTKYSTEGLEKLNNEITKTEKSLNSLTTVKSLGIEESLNKSIVVMDEFIKKVSESNKEINNLIDFSNLENKLIEITQKLEMLPNSYNEIGEKTRKELVSLLKNIDPLIQKAKTTVESFKELKKALEEINGETKETKDTIKLLTKAFNDAQKKSLTLEQEIKNLTNDKKKLQKQTYILANEYNGLIKKYAKLGVQNVELVEKNKKLELSNKNLSQSTENQKNKIKANTEEINKNTQAKEKNNKSSNIFSGLLGKFSKITNGLFNLEILGLGFSKLKDTLISVTTKIKEFVSEYSKMVELKNVTQQVFQDSTKEIESWSKNMGTNLGRSTYAMQSYVSNIASVYKGLGVGGEELKKVSKDLAQFTVDLASFRDIDDERAYTAIMAGIVGETEPLKRLGIVINELAMQEYLHAKGIKEKWNNLNQSEKAMYRYKKIMEETKFIQGDASRTLGTYANQLKEYNSNIQNIKMGLGKIFEPMLNGLLKAMNKFLPAMNKLFSKKTVEDYVTEFRNEVGKINEMKVKYEELSKKALAGNITKEQEDERVSIYQNLKDLYPDIIANISSEASEYEKLNGAIEDVIASLREKTVVQFMEDMKMEHLKELQKNLTSTVDELEKMEEVGKILQETLSQKYGMEIKIGTILEVEEVQNALMDGFQKIRGAEIDENGIIDYENLEAEITLMIKNALSKTNLGENQKEILANALFSQIHKLGSSVEKIKSINAKNNAKIEQGKKEIKKDYEKLSYLLKHTATDTSMEEMEQQIIETFIGKIDSSKEELENVLKTDNNRWAGIIKKEQQLVGTSIKKTTNEIAYKNAQTNGDLHRITHKALNSVVKVANNQASYTERALVRNQDGTYTVLEKTTIRNISKDGAMDKEGITQSKKIGTYDLSNKKHLEALLKLDPQLYSKATHDFEEINKKIEGNNKNYNKDDNSNNNSKTTKEIEKTRIEKAIEELENKNTALKETMINSDFNKLLQGYNESYKIAKKDLEEMKLLNGNDEDKKEHFNKLKSIEDEYMKNLESLHKEWNLSSEQVEKIKEVLKNSNSNIKETEKKLEEIEKNIRLVNIGKKYNEDTKKIQDKLNNNLITKDEFESQNIQALTEKMNSYINEEEYSKAQELKEQIYSKSIALIKENIDKLLKEEGFLKTKGEVLEETIKQIEQQITLAKQNNNLEEETNLKRKKGLLKLSKILNDNKDSWEDLVFLNKIQSQIEKLDSKAIESKKLEEAKKRYDDSLKTMIDNFNNEESYILPLDKIKDIKDSIDYTKPFKEMMTNINEIISSVNDIDETSKKEILEKYSELLKAPKEHFEEYKKLLEKQEVEKEAEKMRDIIFQVIDETINSLKKIVGALKNQDDKEVANELLDVASEGVALATSIAMQDLAGIIKSSIKLASTFVASLVDKFMGEDLGEKAKKEYEARTKELEENTSALRELKETLKNINENLVKQASSNTSNSNLAFYKKYSEAVNETFAKTFNPKLLINGVSQRRLNGFWSILTSGLLNILTDKDETVAYSKDFRELLKYDAKNSQDLKKIYDEKIKNLTSEDLKKFYDKENGFFNNYNLTDINSNLDVIKQQFLNKIKDLEEEEKATAEFEKKAILSSFEGINTVDRKELKKEIIENFKNIYKDNENLEEMIPVFEKKADELVANQESIITAFDNVRNNVYSNIASGKGILETLSSGLETYFNQIRTNLSKVFYDLNFRELEEKFNGKFSDISKKLVEIRLQGKNLGDIKNELDFKELFSSMKDLDNVKNDVREIVLELRKQAQEQGIDISLIDKMLPLEEIESKSKEIESALNKAMSLAINTNSFNQFSMSLGESLYESVRTNLIKAFSESETYKKLFDKYINTEEYKKALESATTPKEHFDLLKKQLNDAEELLRQNGLGFRDTVAGTGEYLNGLTNKANERNKLNESGIKFEITNNLYNYGYVSQNEFLKSLVDTTISEIEKRKKKEV